MLVILYQNTFMGKGSSDIFYWAIAVYCATSQATAAYMHLGTFIKINISACKSITFHGNVTT